MNAMYLLWLRQIKRYMRARSRIVGAIGQPILYLLALGYGLGSVFKRAGQGDYLQFLVPGVIAQTILFSAIFWGIQIIFDRQFGFLKEMLVAPVSRLKIMVGGALGGATIAVFQGTLVLLMSLAIGFRPHSWAALPIAILLMAILGVALACFGSGLGSIVGDMQGFQAINNFIVFPLYFLSGALYPLNDVPAILKFIAAIDPLTYAIDGLRAVLIGVHHYSLATDILALSATTVACILFGVFTFRRIQS